MKEIKLDPEIIIKDRKISYNYEKLRKNNLHLKTEESPLRDKYNIENYGSFKLNPISTTNNTNNITIFNKASVNLTPNNFSKPNMKILFSHNDKLKDNLPVRIKKFDNNSTFLNNLTENNSTNCTINNPNLISFNNFSENIFFTSDSKNKETKDITNYEFDDKFVD